MAKERVQRRLAAILAADVAGYSRLVETDEAGTVARLKALQTELIQPMIAEDGGRVVKVMGDGVLVEFGSAVDAVRNALAIQTEMERCNADMAAEDRIAFRVGINVGDVLIDGDDIHGEGVIIASRLEGLCEPGGIYVSGTVFDQTVGKLEAHFDNLGERIVKNIARPVRVYRARTKLGPTTLPAEAGEQPPLPEKPSIAVLPLENMSGDPEQEYFSDGIAEDLTTALSRIRQFHVIARNSTFSYRGKSSDVRQVAADLHANYLIEGSVRKAGNRVRITVQLIDGPSGNHLWAKRYDRELADIFELQDEITERIVAAIEPALSKAEYLRAKTKRNENLDAWDFCQRGWWHRYQNRQEDYMEARGFFERAIDLDPEFISALAGLSEVLAYEVFLAYADDPAERIESAIRYGQRAVELDAEDPLAHLSLGRAYLVHGQSDQAIHEFQWALKLNPYYVQAFYSLGNSYITLGRLQEGIALVERAITLSPQDLWMGAFKSRLAQAHLSAKDYQKAYEFAEEALRHHAANWPAASYKVSALGHLGRQSEAEIALQDLLRRKPDLTISGMRSGPADAQIGPTFIDDYLDGLRKAGLAE